MKWWGLLVVCTIANVAGAQTAKSPTTLDSVYTREQAARGKNVYAGSCRSCHSSESHTGAVFEIWWLGKQLSELFTFIKTQMPKNDPGALAPEDVADVVAYLLEMNAMPPGRRELYPAADSLKHYRIETKGRQACDTTGCHPPRAKRVSGAHQLRLNPTAATR